jgi:hypothetical protein
MTANITVLNYTDVTVDGVWFEINNTNYTASASDAVTDGNWSGNVYTYNHMFTSDDAGTVTVKQFAENSVWGVNKTNTSTYFNVTVNKWDNNTVVLTSSAGWITSYGDSTTVTCTADEGIPSMTLDSVIVTNPYTATLAVGSYAFACSVPELTNYTSVATSNTFIVAESISGCTNTSTFIYNTTVNLNATQLVLNFTDLVASHMVRSNLGDVMTTTSGVLINTNFTGGYYILLNTNSTGTATVKYGNYYVNSPPANLTMTNATMTSFTSYLMSDYYYYVNTLDEMSLSQQLPPNTTERLTLFCTGGSQEFDIADSRFAIPTFRQMEQIEMTARYSASEMYYRDLLYSDPIEYKTFYMADALEYSVNQYTIKLQDNTLDFGNATLHMKKLIGSDWVTITELHFDAEGKAIVYLINNQQYQITIKSDDGSQERVVGDLYADSVNLNKIIVINNAVAVDTYKSDIYTNLTYDNSTGVIEFTWLDNGNNTNLTEMYVYEYANASHLLFYGSSSNVSSVVLTYTVPDTNAKYIVNAKVHHYTFGLNTLDMSWIVGGITQLIKELVPDQTTLTIICTFALILLIMGFSMAHASTGAIIVALFAVFLSYVELLPSSMLTISIIALFLSILNKASERR